MKTQDRRRFWTVKRTYLFVAYWIVRERLVIPS